MSSSPPGAPSVADLVPAESILDSLPGLVAFVGPDLRCRLMSAGFEAWFGRPRSTMLGIHVRDVVGEGAFAVLEPHLERAFSGARAELDTELQYADSGRRWIHATCVPHRGPSGKVIGLALYVEDIAHRMDAQRAARRAAVLEHVTTALASSVGSQATLQGLTDVVVAEGLAEWSVITVLQGETPLPVAMATSDARFQPRLPELLRLYRPQPGATRGMARVIRTGEPELVPQMDEAFIAGLVATVDQMNVIRQLQPLSYIAVPLAARGRVLGALGLVTTQRHGPQYDGEFLALAREIGWRAGLVLDNAILLERARAAEARLREVIESARDYAILTLDPEGCVVDWNEGARNVFGYEAREMVGQPVSRLFEPEESASGLPRAEMATAAETGRAVDDRWFVRKDGRRFFASGVMAPLRDEDGRLRGFVKVARDITDRKRAAEERRARLQQAEEARAAAEAANRLKDEFLAMVSHELRTPLTAIAGWAHMLEQPAIDPELAARGLEAIGRNAAAQARLLDDLFDMARIVSGQTRLDVQDCALVPVIEAAVETVRPAADAKGIRLQLELPPAAKRVAGDPARLQQVFWNLLANAIKFTPRGGNVEVRLEPGDGPVRIVVADDGEGIVPGFLPHVFDRFQRGATGGAGVSGLGLGLAIVKHLVELHGGTVEARSEGRGRGSTFVVTLPGVPAPAPDR